LNFCLEDGTALSGGREPEPTLVLPDPQSSETKSTPKTAAIPSRNTRSSSSPVRWILYPTLLFLAFLVGAGVVALFYQWNKRESLSSPAQTSKTEPVDTAPPSVPDKKPSPNPPQATKPAVTDQSATQSLSGEWSLVNTIEKTSYPAYINLHIGYHVVINQVGKEFTAEGEKVSEDGRNLPSTGRTPIHMTGFVDGDSASATFVEEGAKRNTSGRFVWRLDAGGSRLIGTFVSTAAKSSGPSIAAKER
jgi:hypothetical protein